MTRLIGWITSWVQAARIARSQQNLAARLKRLEDSRKESLAVLRRRTQVLKEFEERLQVVVSEMESEIANAKQTHLLDKEQLDSARSEVRVLETTIQGLVQANQLYEERWKAQTAIETMRQVLHKPEVE